MLGSRGGAAESALRVLRPRGVLTVTGVAIKPPFYQCGDLGFKELTIRGSFIYQQESEMAIDLLDRGVVDTEPLTSGVRAIGFGPCYFRRDAAGGRPGEGAAEPENVTDD